MCQNLNSTNCQIRIKRLRVYLLIKEGKIKICSEKQKMREFITSRQEDVKENKLGYTQRNEESHKY